MLEGCIQANNRKAALAEQGYNRFTLSQPKKLDPTGLNTTDKSSALAIAP
ncbi:MAG TPA: hypothetical protein PKD90_12695 [Phnomibacter sp.]|nr:hypothetical protein [Phnomibacter sp.]